MPRHDSFTGVFDISLNAKQTYSVRVSARELKQYLSPEQDFKVAALLGVYKQPFFYPRVATSR